MPEGAARGLTPPEWEITIIDENLGARDYPALPRPDLVGITAFTSQANRAYEVAAHFRGLGLPVVLRSFRFERVGAFAQCIMHDARGSLVRDAMTLPPQRTLETA